MTVRKLRVGVQNRLLEVVGKLGSQDRVPHAAAAVVQVVEVARVEVAEDLPDFPVDAGERRRR